MASKPFQSITREIGFFMPFIPLAGYLFSYLLSGYRYALSAALWRVKPFRTPEPTIKTDRAHSSALARHSMAKKIFRRPKSHYTARACGFGSQIFSSWDFLQTTPPARATAWALRPGTN
ncbi:hypothetical protein VI119_01080 [Enterobacter cloacae subsp. cloacae]